MKVVAAAIVLVLLVGGAGLAAAQTPTVGQVGPSPSLGLMGTTNPQSSVFIIRPSPTGPFVVVPQGTPFSRETIPFGDEPNRANNAHPMMPAAGLGYAVRQVWVPAPPIAMQALVPAPSRVPASYQTQVVAAPGVSVPEKTTGAVIAEAFAVHPLHVGVYPAR